MLRELLLATSAAVVVVVVYLISEALPPAPAPPADVARQRALQRRLPGVIHIRGTLREVVEQLGALGHSIDVHWGRPDDRWPYVDRPDRPPIDIRLRDATVEQWLRAIEFQQGAWQTSVWIGTDGRIKMASNRLQKPPVAAKVYDVRDLQRDAVHFAQLFPRRDPYPWPDQVDPPPPSDWLATSDFIDPVLFLAGGYTWGGRNEPQVGTSDDLDGRLFVTHTPQTHRRIEVLLAALRAHRSQPVALKGEHP